MERGPTINDVGPTRSGVEVEDLALTFEGAGRLLSGLWRFLLLDILWLFPRDNFPLSLFFRIVLLLKVSLLIR